MDKRKELFESIKDYLLDEANRKADGRIETETELATRFNTSRYKVRQALREGANKRGNSSRLTQSFHFFMFEPIFSPVNALNQPI
ncbi:hypothetical protein [Escherichia coli]|uniref:hypothetical protein n=1 Tax=Escherichia coli TaxID=562 RepID=UPI0020239A49|nr:hypothetical protein [Escherichia coli]